MWDYGAALTQIDLDVNGSAAPTTRAFVKGSGTERELLVGYATDTTPIGLGFPAVDHVNSDHTSATVAATLNGYARADLKAFAAPTETWKCSVQIDGLSSRGVTVSPGLGTWALGDAPVFGISGHPWIPDGQYRRRILGYDNDKETSVSLQLQSTMEAL